MFKNNPYIPKVHDHSHIFTQAEEIYSHNWAWKDFFWNNHPIILEIGTGMGNFFGKQAESYPEKNFIGMEIRYKRLYTSIEKALIHGNNNALMIKDLGQNITKIFGPEEISETYVFFPDPYCNKKKQLKHRLFQEKFLSDLYERTIRGWTLIFKTDHREYFDTTKQIIESQNLWTIETWTHNYEKSEYFDMSNITEFEALYRGEKIEINYIVLRKK